MATETPQAFVAADERPCYCQALNRVYKHMGEIGISSGVTTYAASGDRNAVFFVIEFGYEQKTQLPFALLTIKDGIPSLRFLVPEAAVMWYPSLLAEIHGRSKLCK